MILVFFGMTASGKSTLAAACAARWHAPRYNTDQMRKELAGLAPGTRRPDGIEQGIYTRDMSVRTYQALLGQAEADIRAGAPLVLLDGSYSQLAERDRVRQAAARLACPALFVYCHCSRAETMRRLALRGADRDAVSDGRPEIYRYQQKTFDLPGAEEPGVIRLDSEDRPEALVARLEGSRLIPLPAA